MTDAQFIPKLVALAADVSTLDALEKKAAAAIYAFDKEIYPSDSCAITQSKLFQAAGIEIPDTFTALGFDNLLKARGWMVIPKSGMRLEPGDIGTTCFAVPDHGVDHVYLVLRPINPNENLIADNQSKSPHVRFVDGTGGKSPTQYFLRAQ